MLLDVELQKDQYRKFIVIRSILHNWFQ